ncbi:hypothetical protein SO3561_08087 [Streptomyces olivochromogenes]|uniref:Bacterial Ig-like domain-containing protein n=1 Tax=Streptomyces olivochromogenes TaxID=1963 RepID=A0A250VR11_STROL|nr:hypothetical protein SO3561_08087 [Streptomyces olivochromogenes]
MTRWKDRAGWNLVTVAALTALVALASPAAAAGSSTTTVQASPSAATVGQPVNLTATVTCAVNPTGGLGVTFFDGGDILDTVPVTAGAAVFTARLSTVGAHTITATYNGNDDCGASHAETTVVISAASVPTPPNGLCLLACGGLINFNVGDIHNEINIHRGI